MGWAQLDRGPVHLPHSAPERFHRGAAGLCRGYRSPPRGQTGSQAAGLELDGGGGLDVLPARQRVTDGS